MRSISPSDVAPTRMRSPSGVRISSSSTLSEVRRGEGLRDVAALGDRGDRLEMRGDVAARLHGRLDAGLGGKRRGEQTSGGEQGELAKTHTSPSLESGVWHAAGSGSRKFPKRLSGRNRRVRSVGKGVVTHERLLVRADSDPRPYRAGIALRIGRRDDAELMDSVR